jgi:hypothetical protein
MLVALRGLVQRLDKIVASHDLSLFVQPLKIIFSRVSAMLISRERYQINGLPKGILLLIAL